MLCPRSAFQTRKVRPRTCRPMSPNLMIDNTDQNAEVQLAPIAESMCSYGTILRTSVHAPSCTVTCGKGPPHHSTIKAKAREGHLKLLNVFVIIGYNWRKIITYDVPNNVGKMTTKMYTEVILPQLLEELKDQSLTLCQDADSVYISKATIT